MPCHALPGRADLAPAPPKLTHAGQRWLRELAGDAEHPRRGHRGAGCRLPRALRELGGGAHPGRAGSSWRFVRAAWGPGGKQRWHHPRLRAVHVQPAMHTPHTLHLWTATERHSGATQPAARRPMPPRAQLTDACIDALVRWMVDEIPASCHTTLSFFELLGGRLDASDAPVGWQGGARQHKGEGEGEGVEWGTHGLRPAPQRKGPAARPARCRHALHCGTGI